MSNTSQQIVNKAWSFARVRRDDRLSYMAYAEQMAAALAQFSAVAAELKRV